MRDCESQRADKGGPNARKLVMQSRNDSRRHEDEKDTGVGWRGDESLQA